ncbi:hypothetical protein BDM02DRAFT_3266494 [Thelephora ganbajun]|uniref:Uncharacterized protein n=1 Tax=Thelephora ganbajun TaxID=370292 RepID=A0ACB6ZR40_THEGA|nr:hypothetical protein BDM02DRAFT_3266494 [Thelephora ganbajun]
MGISLDTLPFDVILRVFYHLSAYDIVRTCQTCKHLKANLEEHHVWLELAAKCCSRNISVACHILPLTAHSTDELRTLVVEQAMVDRYWARETALTSPLPRFQFPASTRLMFCGLLSGGRHLVLVHRNGDISLQSLVDLGNIHEISRLSLGLRTDYARAASLITDHTGRTLLALCVYGSPGRVFLATLDVETKSINVVKYLETETAVLAVTVRHDTVVCLCQDMELGHNAFTFVITTLDDTVKRVLCISGIPVNPVTVFLCDICLPTPMTLILFEVSNIRCYHLPDLSEVAPGNHHLSELPPVWSWDNPTIPKTRLTSNSSHNHPPPIGKVARIFISERR